MQKILFTNSVDVTFEAEKINKMFQLGLDILHIRKSNYTKEKLKQFIQKIDLVNHPKIMIHDHYELLADFKLKGIHINRKYRKNFWFNFYTLKRIRNKYKDICISYSADSISQINHLQKKNISYIILGRIFSSNTTNRISLNFNKNELIQLNTNSKTPIIALGGIDNFTTHKSILMGFTGIALQSFIWDSINSIENFTQIINIIEGQELVQISNQA